MRECSQQSSIHLQVKGNGELQVTQILLICMPGGLASQVVPFEPLQSYRWILTWDSFAFGSDS